MGKNKQNGITLIALVITIIVLLILAGLTINLTIGQDGIITKAQQAGKNYVDAANYENQMLKDFESMTDDIIANVTGVNGGTDTPPAPTEKTGKLTEIITASDYGKTINYSANGVTDWKVFYNDGSNVYIIASDYLDNTKIDTTKTGMTITGTYQAYWAGGSLASPANKSAVATLTNTDNWSAFVDSSKAQSAIGAPTIDMWVASWNAKGYTKLYTATDDTGYYIGTSANPSTASINMSSDTAGYGNKLYYPHTESSGYSGCYGYWLASPSANGPYGVIDVACSGRVGDNLYTGDAFGVRPVVCLQAGITGTVGTSVSMD